VGQESRLQPAVLEPAAVRSPAFTGVGVKIGVKATGHSSTDWMPLEAAGVKKNKKTKTK
jgi:hypothetical protein